MIKSYTILLSHDDWSLYTEKFREDELYVKVIRRIPFLEDLTENVMGIIYAKDKSLYKHIIKMISRNKMVVDFKLIDEYKSKSGVRAIYASIEKLPGRIAEKLLQNCKIFSMSETIYNGLERWNIIAESNSFIKVIPKIRELTFDFKVFEDPIDPLLSVKDELTPKEQEVLKIAVTKGYFDYPKRIGLEELAEEFGVSKSAIMQILRKAIDKIARKSIREI